MLESSTTNSLEIGPFAICCFDKSVEIVFHLLKKTLSLEKRELVQYHNKLLTSKMALKLDCFNDLMNENIEKMVRYLASHFKQTSGLHSLFDDTQGHAEETVQSF